MSKSYIRFWGVRGSYTSPFKTHLEVGGNTPCVEINVDGHVLICDAGTGIIIFRKSKLGLLLLRYSIADSVSP